MASSDKINGLDYLKAVAKHMGSGSLEYIKYAMPTTTSTISGARETIDEVNSKLKTTASDIMPRVRQLKNQANIRSLMNWFVEKENTYSNDHGTGDLGDWDDGTSQSEIAEQQISESKANADQISGAITESIHKSIESNIDMTASLSLRIDAQTAAITSGFDKVSTLLSSILEVVTKNTSAIIETQVASSTSSDKMLSSGKFNLGDYKNIIKDNFNQTGAGVGLSMAQAMVSTMFTGGQGPSARQLVSLGMSAALDKFAPKLKDNMRALDDAVSDVLMQSLVRLGNSRWDGGPKGALAKVFGIDGSRKEVDTTRTELSLKATPFDTVAKESLVGAIPGYLRKILVAVGGPDLVYDYRSRSFKTQNKIASDYMKQAASYNVGSLKNAPKEIQAALGNDSWTNMIFDALINHIGSELNGSKAFNDIDKKFKDPKFIENLIREKIFAGNMTKMDSTNAKIFSKRLASVNDDMAYGSLQTQAAMNNARRNKSMPEYVTLLQSLGVDLSFIKDSPNNDRKGIFKEYGRGDLSSISYGSGDELSGVNYTNAALYEIFRRLDAGINVFQVGSNNSRTKPFKRMGDRYLKKPSRYRATSSETDIDESGQGVLDASWSRSTDGQPNLLRNNATEDGGQENLTKGQRFSRWGKSRAKQLGSAMIHANPAEVKDVFLGTIHDMSGVASDSMKRGIATINERFGNISGYLGHKMFGTEYTYNEIDPETGKKIAKTIGKNEKGGMFGFVTDKMKGMFEVAKEKGRDWFSDVAGYFDYGGDNDEDGQIANKRKKLLKASVGAMAGAGILGGPVGLIMGAVAGNAIGSIPDIGKKLKDSLFGKDEDGKPTGLLSKAADVVISPIQYQFQRTMSFLGDKLKKNILGPLSDIGYVLKNRITSKVEGIFGKFFHGVLNLGAKALGGIGKLGAKIFEGVIGAKGIKSRGKIGAVTGIAGFGINRVADMLSLGTPGLHAELSDRRKRRNEQIEEKSEKFEGGYKGWLSRKYEKNKNNGIDDLAEYTREQVISTKEIEDSNDEIVSNTGKTVEILTEIKDKLSGNQTSKSDKVSEGSTNTSAVSEATGNDNKIIQFPGNKRSEEKSEKSDKIENSRTGDAYVGAASTAAAISGFSDTEIKHIDELGKAANRGEAKGSLLKRFKTIMSKNKEESDNAKADSDKKDDSLLSKVIDGIGGVVTNFWPVIVGGLALFNEDFRKMLTDVLGEAIISLGGWLGENLPSIISGSKKVLNDVSTGVDAAISGGDVVKDEVTGDLKSVVSAETHAEDLQEGINKSSWKKATSKASLIKDAITFGAGRTTARVAAGTVQAVSTVAKGAGGIASFLGTGATKLGTTLTNRGAMMMIDGARGGKVAYTIGNLLTRGGSKVAPVGQAIKSGGSTVASGAAGVKQGFQRVAYLNPGKVIKSLFSPKVVGNVVGGIAAGMTHDFAWEAVESAKHANIVGDYGLGNAGGYVRTNATVKTVSGMAVATAGGFVIGEAIAAAAGATSLFTVANGWNPIGWAAAIITAVLLVAAAIAALVNWITGIVTDANDRGYAIRTNASRMKGAINGTIEYVNGKQNPMYAYCGQESDRVIGLTDGLFIKDPEIVFGRYLKMLVETLPQAPGTEVLLYDWINNMAVQGVPFACLVAGDSDEAKVKGKHANKETTGDPEVESEGFFSDKTQVRKSTVKRNWDAIYSDIANNINRNDSSLLWSLENLQDIYKYGQEVVDKLKSVGILDGKGKVKTSGFKGKPYSGKNDSGWTALHDICKSSGSYFLTKCLVYINSKIEADDKTGKQWLEMREEDLGTLFDGLKDVLLKEYDAEIERMRSEGMSDKEIEDAVRNTVDPKGKKAEAASSISAADYSNPMEYMLAKAKERDQADINKEIQYIAAAYAYSHPTFLSRWAGANREATDLGVDDISAIARWDSDSMDSRMKKSLRSRMKGAALAFGAKAGDIFNLLPKFDWSEDGKLYGANKKKVDKYGSAFVLRGEETKSSEGILDKVFESSDDITPDEVHDKMYGRITHGKGAESSDISGYDWTMGGNGVMARIANKIALFGSPEGESLTAGESGDKWRNVLFNLPASSPSNMPEDMKLADSAKLAIADRFTNAKKTTIVNGEEVEGGVGGPMESGISSAISTVAMTDDGASSEVAEDESQVEGGNPLDRPYRITSNFGPRKSPKTGIHNGVDIVSADGGETQIGSRFEGVVTEVKRDVPDDVRAKKVGNKWVFPYEKKYETGNMVSIKTNDGMTVRNMHLKAGSIPNNISPGAKVNIGQRIGTMGSTGWSTGNHLHYEFRDSNNNAIDPTDSLSSPSSFNTVTGDSSSYDNYGSYSNSGIQTSYSAEETSESKGLLGTLLDGLKDLGNQALFKITGGLIGSDSSSTDSTSTMTGTMTFSSNGGYSSSYNNGAYLTGNSNSAWLKIVRDIKKLVAEQRPSYNQSGYITINYNGKSLKVRTDCTGIICAMLKCYGVMGDSENLNSTMMLKPGAIKNGFDQASFPGWDKLVEGDILVTNGHAEIFAFNDGNKHYVYNGGDTGPLCTPGATRSSHSSYAVIWRCREAVVESPVPADASTIGNSSSDSVYKELMKHDYSNAAAAGILGTWDVESKNSSKTVEGDYLSGYPGYDKVMNSVSSMTSYTNDFLFPAYARSGIKIDRGGYVGTDGYMYPGIGLAQWTGERHQKLKNYADQQHVDWRDMSTQVKYMDVEKASRGIDDSFKQIDDPTAAAEIFARKFEGTKNSSALRERMNKAQEYFNKYANTSTDNASIDPSANTDGMGGPSETTSLLGSSIGRSNYSRRSGSARKFRKQGVDATSIRSTTSNGTNQYPDSSRDNPALNNTEVVTLLRDVLIELRAINGNTGNSTALLKSIGDNGIVDKGLRDQLNSIKPSRSGSRSSNRINNPNRPANARLVGSMVRP